MTFVWISKSKEIHWQHLQVWEKEVFIEKCNSPRNKRWEARSVTKELETTKHSNKPSFSEGCIVWALRKVVVVTVNGTIYENMRKSHNWDPFPQYASC